MLPCVARSARSTVTNAGTRAVPSPPQVRTTIPAPTRRTSSASSGVPTAVDAGLRGPPTRPVATTGDDSPTEAGGILMTRGVLVAGGAIGSLRCHSRWDARCPRPCVVAYDEVGADAPYELGEFRRIDSGERRMRRPVRSRQAVTTGGPGPAATDDAWKSASGWWGDWLTRMSRPLGCAVSAALHERV